MGTDFDRFDLEAATREDEGSGFLGMALLALALGAGTALLFAPAEGAKTRKVVGGRLRDLRGGAEEAMERLQREIHRRDVRRRRERRSSALIGLAVGAGLAALLVPKSGPETRRRLSDRLKRHKEAAEQERDRVVREPQPDPEPAG
jgi:gas vesicle protein